MSAAVAAAILTLSVASPSRADSDGYYCVGSDYLAYQLRAGLSTGAVSGHVLRVVRFGPDGIQFAGEVALEDFQPHKMVCGDKEVHIGGWSTRPVEYVVDISAPSGPRIAHVVSDPQRASQRTSLKNLGGWARSGSVVLPSSDRSHAFQLVVHESEERAGGEILHHKRSELLMIDADGQVVQRLALFEGHIVETID